MGKKPKKISEKPDSRSGSEASSDSGSQQEEKKKKNEKSSERSDDEAPDSSKPKEAPEKKKGRSQNCCRRCFARFHTWLRSYTSRKVVLFYAVYTTFFAIMAIVLAAKYWSITECGLSKYKSRNVWFVCWSIGLPCSLIGIIGAIKRNRKLTRIWYFSMPCIVFINIGNTVTLAKLFCTCDSHRQCASLQSFAEEGFIIPFPKTKGGSFPWKDPPPKKRAYGLSKTKFAEDEGTSLVQSELSEALPSAHLNNRHLQRIQFGRGVQKLMVSPISPPPELTSKIYSTASFSTVSPSLLQVHEPNENKIQNQQQKDPSTSETVEEQEENLSTSETDTETPETLTTTTGVTEVDNDDEVKFFITSEQKDPFFKELSTEQREMKQCRDFFAPEALIDAHHEGVIMSRSDAQHVSLRKNTNDPTHQSKVDLRRLYLFEPLRTQFQGNTEGGSVSKKCCQYKVKRRGFEEGSDLAKNDFKAKVLTCRRDFTKTYETKCPKEVERNLQDCIQNPTCGGVQFTILERKTQKDIALKEARKKKVWLVFVCFHDHPVEPVSSPNLGELEEADDQDDKWEKADPLVVYFMRDMQRKLDDTGQISFGNGVPPLTQAKWEWQDWLDYMANLRSSGCHCDPLSKSCSAYSPGGAKDGKRISYWCPIERKSQAACRQRLLPGGSMTDIQLYKMPGGKQLWSPDICTQAPENEQEKKEPPKPRCECMQGTGFKMTGPERNKVSPKILRAASNKAEVLVGYKCDKWLKEDEKDWCVVGFDSACADREEQVISAGIRLRVFKSHIPCERAELPELLRSASKSCKLVVILWWIGDIPRYLLFPIMFAFVHQWLQNKCMDVGQVASGLGGWNFAEDEDTGVLREENRDFFDSEESYRSSSYSEYSEEEKPKAKGTEKGKNK